MTLFTTLKERGYCHPKFLEKPQVGGFQLEGARSETWQYPLDAEHVQSPRLGRVRNNEALGVVKFNWWNGDK
jgi:hypothetical protein